MKKIIATLVFYSLLFFGLSKALGAVSITPSTLPTLLVEHPVNEPLNAVGGVRPYTWLATGTLPTGLTLVAGTSSVASLQGTPTTPGVYTFTISATDANASVGTVTYTTTVAYNYLTVPQMTDIWVRSTPTEPYIFDTWNSLSPVLTGVSPIVISGTSPSYTISTTSTVTAQPTITGSGATTVTSGVNSYTVTTPATSIAGVGSLTVTGTSPSYSVSSVADGAWNSVAFNAGDFAAVGGGTWTVEAGDLTSFRYKMLTTKTMAVSVIIATSTIATTPSTIRVTIPNGQTGVTASTSGSGVFSDAGTLSYLSVGITGTTIQLFPLTGTFADGANTQGVSFTVIFEIQ